MLDGMRKASQNWIGRSIMAVLMGFIILSFAIWGIGDIFRGFTSSTVATVGTQTITAEQVRFAYQTQLQRMQQQFRRAITNEQARAFGLDRQIVTRLVAEASLDQRATSLGLAMSTEDLADAVRKDPAFAGLTGKFDVSRFNEALRDAGLSEQAFIREQRKVYLRRQIAETLSGGMKTPKATLAAVHRYRFETRAIDYVVLPDSALDAIAPAAQDVLQKFYEDRKTAFRTAEYRKFVTLAITPEGIADPTKISDDDAKARYERVKGEKFGTAEKRQIQQMVFANEDEAKAASQKIKDGASFQSIAQERKLSDADVNLGNVTRGEIADASVAQAAFTLAAGAVSEPVKGQFGYVLVRVEAIQPESVKNFADVAGQLKADLALERAKGQVQILRDKIEDERTSGKTLTEAAQIAGMQVRTVEGITAAGLDKAGNLITDLAERDALLKAVFASDVGVDNDTINGSTGGVVWFEVAGVEPARQLTFDEAKTDVERNWKDEEIARRLSEKADALVEKIKSGTSMEDLAKETGLELKHAGSVQRIGGDELPQGVIARVFALPSGSAGSASGDGFTRVVFKITDSQIPPVDFDSDTIKGAADQILAAMNEDILAQYVTKLQTDQGVRINDAAVQAAIGGNTDPNGLF
jgi:peptidyl-prolyl cis-trans isomerase D